MKLKAYRITKLYGKRRDVANIVRVHDVAEIKRVATICDAIRIQ